mmetsp:Transcript_19382/g.36016  ORF Transcript_19382/g.36016 Transcript_19382/m.36016 type:complete len:205 (-) Transcript_19382:4475-5089(-)
MSLRTSLACVKISLPASQAPPELGGNSPLKMLSVVVFPAPLIPSRPKQLPYGMPMLKPLTANLPPGYTFVSWSTMIASSEFPRLGAPDLMPLAFNLTLSSSAFTSLSSSNSATGGVFQMHCVIQVKSIGVALTYSIMMARNVKAKASTNSQFMSFPAITSSPASSSLPSHSASGSVRLSSMGVKKKFELMLRRPWPKQNVGKSR